jgi:hypothetical protein
VASNHAKIRQALREVNEVHAAHLETRQLYITYLGNIKVMALAGLDQLNNSKDTSMSQFKRLNSSQMDEGVAQEERPKGWAKLQRLKVRVMGVRGSLFCYVYLFLL